MNSLAHVEEGAVVKHPQVVVGDGDLVEGDLLGVLEEDVGAPERVEPVDVEYPVVCVRCLVEPQAAVPPALGQEYVGCVRLSTPNEKKTLNYPNQQRRTFNNIG